MPVPAHRHRETFSHLIGSYGYILYGRVANPLYIDMRLVAHGQVPPARSELEGHEGGMGRQDKRLANVPMLWQVGLCSSEDIS